MSSTLRVVVTVAAIAGLAVLAWYLWNLAGDNEDRPPIRVKNGSVEFHIDPPAKGYADAKWSRKVSSGGKRPFRAEAGKGKEVVSFKLELQDGKRVVCSASGTEGEFTFRNIGGRTLPIVLTIENGHARFELPEDGLLITTPHPRTLVLDGKTEGVHLVSAKMGGTQCDFPDDPKAAEYVVFQVH